MNLWNGLRTTTIVVNTLNNSQRFAILETSKSKRKTPRTMNKQTYKERKEKYLGWIKELAQSQGFYGRLYKQLQNDSMALEMLLENDFKDAVDMVLWLEC
jgi:hypothetical protein